MCSKSAAFVDVYDAEMIPEEVKQVSIDELRARHRLSKFLLRHGRRPPIGVKAWTIKYLEWVTRGVHFEQLAQEATLLDYLHEVEHGAARIARLDGVITEAAKSAPPQMRAVIEALQALRGIAQVSAVTVVAELGELSRFSKAKQLMAYGGIVPSEDSSGERLRRGNITKTGNAHLRRVVVEAAWAYRHRPAMGAKWNFSACPSLWFSSCSPHSPVSSTQNAIA